MTKISTILFLLIIVSACSSTETNLKGLWSAKVSDRSDYFEFYFTDNKLLVYSESMGGLLWDYEIGSDTLKLTRRTADGLKMSQEITVLILETQNLTLLLDEVESKMQKVISNLDLDEFMKSNNQEVFDEYINSYFERRNSIN